MVVRASDRRQHDFSVPDPSPTLFPVGQVVGQTNTPALISYHGFLYSNGIMQDIGGGLIPAGVNDSGVVVGRYFANTTGTPGRAFAYSNGVFQDLGAFPGGNGGAANAINNAGQITGGASNAVATHAFLLANGVMQDLGTLGGTSSTALGINSHGDVVGESQTGVGPGTGYDHAFLYTASGGMVDIGPSLGDADTTAYGVNDSDQVVGYINGDSGYRAFLYSGGTLYNLNDLIDSLSGVALAKAVGINDAGQIIAWGSLGQLGYPIDTEAFLLTPTTPEPGAWAIAAATALGLLARRPGEGNIGSYLR